VTGEERVLRVRRVGKKSTAWKKRASSGVERIKGIKICLGRRPARGGEKVIGRGPFGKPGEEIGSRG